jgi:hypothetical protein
MCVSSDYWGLQAKVSNYHFERMFRITRGYTERIIQVCLRFKPSYFACRESAFGKQGIPTYMKVLAALKTVAFGVGAVCFTDYFQISETTIHYSVLWMFESMAHDEELLSVYLPKLTRHHARIISKKHKEVFDVEGLLGAIDCMHLWWKNCPMAFKGQYQGKEKKATLVLEAVAEYDLWIWHQSFGFPGTQNDITIWEQSPLLKDILDGKCVLDCF